MKKLIFILFILSLLVLSGCKKENDMDIDVNTTILQIRDVECVEKCSYENNIKYMTLGDSMYPNLENGTEICIEKYINQDLSVGEVIIFNDLYGGFLAHRIIELEINYKYPTMPNSLIYTRGDNNANFETTKIVEVQGIVTGRIC